MKTLRYLLSLIAILSVVSIIAATFGKPYQPQRRGAQYAQNYSEMPTLSMGSTGSAMMSSGSALPMAAVTGTTSADDYASGGPRRAKMEDDDGDGWEDEEENTHIGEPNPIGDAVLPLMLFACAYFIWRRRRIIVATMRQG